MKSKSSFDPFETSDYLIFRKYNSNFSLPRCYPKEKCLCFKFKLVFYDYKQPIFYIRKLKKIVKNFHKNIEEHNNVHVFKSDPRANTSTIKNVIKSISCHIKTLKIFSIIFDQYENQTKKKSRKKNLLFLRKFSPFSHFINKSLMKCKKQKKALLEKIRKQEMTIPKLFLDLTIYSHYHTLTMFEIFVNNFYNFITISV